MLIIAFAPSIRQPSWQSWSRPVLPARLKLQGGVQRGSRSLASQQWAGPGSMKLHEAASPHTPTMQRGRGHSLHQGSPLTPPSFVTTPNQLRSYLVRLVEGSLLAAEHLG